MPSSPYIPRADAKFESWARQFVKEINASPYSFGLSPADGEALMRAFEDFSKALARANVSDTRTTRTIMEKNDARASLENFCRRYAAIIRAINGVSDTAKVSVGVRPRNASLTRRVPPSASPELHVLMAANGLHEIHINDSTTPARKARPFGAVCMQLFCAITETGPEIQPPTVDEAKFVSVVTRATFMIGHDSKDAGRTATYWGRWQSQRGDTGPWSLPASFTIAFGGAGAGNTMKTKTKGGPKHDAPPLRIEGETEDQPLKRAA